MVKVAYDLNLSQWYEFKNECNRLIGIGTHLLQGHYPVY